MPLSFLPLKSKYYFIFDICHLDTQEKVLHYGFNCLL